jgi:hypothetical protein
MRLALRVLAEPGGRVALVDGFLEQDGREIAITGFADLDGQAEESDRCALAITACDEARNRTVAMGGWLEGEAGLLLLQALTGHATPLDGAYLQTSLWPLSLVRRTGRDVAAAATGRGGCAGARAAHYAAASRDGAGHPASVEGECPAPEPPVTPSGCSSSSWKCRACRRAWSTAPG